MFKKVTINRSLNTLEWNVIMNEKDTTMLKKVGFSYTADETAEFFSAGIFRVLAYRVMTEPFPLEMLKNG